MRHQAARITTGALKSYPSTSFDFGTGDFTAGAMVRSRTGGPVLSHIAATGAGFVLAINADATVTFMTTDGTATSTFTTAATALFDGGCHGIAAVRRNGVLAVVIDGTPVAGASTGSSQSLSIGNGLAVTIGTTPWASASPAQLTGDVMHVGLWSAALAAQQLSLAMFARITTLASGLAGYWTLDGTTDDSSPQDNPLQIAGPIVYFPCFDCVWVEGGNAYSYCTIENEAGGGSQTASIRQTVVVASGAPALLGSIVDGSGTVTYPTGVTVSITDPNGQAYVTAMNTDSVYVQLANGSPWLFAILNPAPGTWAVQITAPAAIQFRFQMQTVPSTAIPQTMLSTLTPYYAGGPSGFARGALAMTSSFGFWDWVEVIAVAAVAAVVVGVVAVFIFAASIPVAVAAAVGAFAVVTSIAAAWAMTTLDPHLSISAPAMAGMGGLTTASKSVLLGDANVAADLATQLSYTRRAATLYPAVVASPYKSKQASLVGPALTRAALGPALQTADVGYVSINGHGLSSYLTGYYSGGIVGNPLEEIANTSWTTAAQAGGKIFHLFACKCGANSASGLGQFLVRNGARAFFGYSDSFAMPLAHANDFIDCDIAVDTAMLAGKTAAEAHAAAMTAFDDKIAALFAAGLVTAAATLRSNRDIFVSPVTSTAYGDATAKIET